MKKFKKLVPFLLIFTLLIGLYGCGTKSPSDTTKEYLEEVKKGENGDFSSLVNKTFDKGENKAAETNKDESSKKLTESMKKLTYTINSEKIDGDKAVVNVKVNGPDVGNVMVDYMQKAVAMAFNEAFSGKEPTKEETEKLYEKLLIECLNNIKFTDRTGDISLTKVDGKWKISGDDSLTKLLINIDASAFDSKSGEDKTTKTK